MKPGLYVLGFGIVDLIVRVNPGKEDVAKVVRVTSKNEATVKTYLGQHIYCDSLWLEKEPIFKSKGAKPLTLAHKLQSKALLEPSVVGAL